jgi:hypothetical protein
MNDHLITVLPQIGVLLVFAASPQGSRHGGCKRALTS